MKITFLSKANSAVECIDIACLEDKGKMDLKGDRNS